ncbi:unnamed protein product [Aspergillus oryzae]|uniref:Unnamed protein product n=2 Tax=Aspergillus oryzae TaxID=5062 RepID=A0AAN4YT68_ASPOZ|nr:unnamed protein product [Aspergillus oryzae]GMF86569.1 unnamed protein product [Aspergillus oryzae]GMG10415.1 unnamed protein product [Aspergillus oryzae]GMG37496.1 unnamed protein product [Aspergillus oryzae]GMG40749.1 unnamed protein product [Aspergillus oryzae var. brunneus]
MANPHTKGSGKLLSQIAPEKDAICREASQISSNPKVFSQRSLRYHVQEGYVPHFKGMAARIMVLPQAIQAQPTYGKLQNDTGPVRRDLLSFIGVNLGQPPEEQYPC